MIHEQPTLMLRWLQPNGDVPQLQQQWLIFTDEKPEAAGRTVWRNVPTERSVGPWPCRPDGELNA
jgi:hypothetical protein